MSATGLKTLLVEGGGESYGITGGDLNSRRPVSTMFRVDTSELNFNRIGSKTHPSQGLMFPACINQSLPMVGISLVVLK